MNSAERSYLVSGGPADPLLPHLLQAIDRATAIQMVVSFTRSSGLRLISSALEKALKAYIFIRNHKEGVAFIGSSNLSASALVQGVERRNSLSPVAGR